MAASFPALAHDTEATESSNFKYSLQSSHDIFESSELTGLVKCALPSKSGK